MKENAFQITFQYTESFLHNDGNNIIFGICAVVGLSTLSRKPQVSHRLKTEAEENQREIDFLHLPMCGLDAVDFSDPILSVTPADCMTPRLGPARGRPAR